MPGVTPRIMNGFHDYDQSALRGSGMAKPSRYDPYRDVDYSERVDPYRRDDDDIYRAGQSRHRFDYIDQSSVEMRNTNEPSFELDHLATFAAWTRDGYIQPEDGLLKLRQMENTTGIWTMRCMLLVEKKFIVILDNQSGDELERFPIQSVHSPTAIFNNDTREIYNNLLLLTVGEDPKKRTQADMHIFQSVDIPSQKIVDEILVAQKGGRNIPPAPRQAPPHPSDRDRDMYNFNGMKESINTQQTNSRFFGRDPTRSMKATRNYREDYEPGQNEVLERDVQLLNHCFDDIEKFVSRLQQAAESYKELEKRKKDGNSRDKKRQSGEGLMGYRARPPPSSDFTDIFRKFKLSFNLLAKLKAHIHDPNAPELVHFLFTPLSLIYEASRDPVHGNQNLAESAIAPILTADAKQLLLNCLTSKEIELWRALGNTWTISREEWKGYIPNYTPRFYDGWQPAPGQIENGFNRGNPELEVAVRSRYEDEPQRFVADSEPRYGGYNDDYQSRRTFETRDARPVAPPSPRPALASSSAVYRDSRPRPGSHHSNDDDNNAYLPELRSMGLRACEVIHDREGRNNKELSLSKGEIVGVIDDSRNWWKVRNSEGKVGFAPYTIMKELTD